MTTFLFFKTLVRQQDWKVNKLTMEVTVKMYRSLSNKQTLLISKLGE